jgi:hypothetical protein
MIKGGVFSIPLTFVQSKYIDNELSLANLQTKSYYKQNADKSG